MRLTKRMIDALLSCLSEAQAGGYQGQTEGLSDKEALAFEKDADKAHAWCNEQLRKREAKSKRITT